MDVLIVFIEHFMLCIKDKVNTYNIRTVKIRVMESHGIFKALLCVTD